MGLRGPAGAAGTVGGGRGRLNVRFKFPVRTQKFFDNVGVNVEEAMDNVLRNVADKIMTQAMENLSEGFKGPSGEDGGAYDTGVLANGFRIKDEPMKKVIGNNVSYAAHMEFGTGPAAGKKRYMPPYGDGSNLQSWSNRQQIGDAASVARTIYNPGTLPRRYLGRAFHTRKAEVLLQFAKELENKISETVGVRVVVRRR